MVLSETMNDLVKRDVAYFRIALVRQVYPLAPSHLLLAFPITFKTPIFIFSQPCRQPTILHVFSTCKFIKHRVKLCQRILFSFGKLT